MRNLDARLEKLEATQPARSGRVFRVIGGREGESAANFIRAQGQEVDETADLILHRVIVAPTPTGPHRVDTAMRFAA